MFMKRRFLFEADDDAGSTENEGENSNTENNETDSSDNKGDDDSKSNNNDDADEDENIDGDRNDDKEDFDIDSEEDQEEGEENGDNSDDTSTDDSSVDDTSTDTDSEEKQMDRDMFETLSDAEKKQKTEILKKLFLELYNRCDVIIDQYDATIDRYNDITPIGKRVIQTLYDLKIYISDYVIKLFDSKSYMENDVMYNRCLSVLNGIKMVTKDVAKMVEKQEK